MTRISQNAPRLSTCTAAQLRPSHTVGLPGHCRQLHERVIRVVAVVLRVGFVRVLQLLADVPQDRLLVVVGLEVLLVVVEVVVVQVGIHESRREFTGAVQHAQAQSLRGSGRRLWQLMVHGGCQGAR